MHMNKQPNSEVFASDNLEKLIYDYQLAYSKVDRKRKLLIKMKDWCSQNKVPIPRILISQIEELESEKEEIYQNFCDLIHSKPSINLYH